MKSRFVLILFLASCSLSSSVAHAADGANQERSRLDDLFIWKASEELKLPPEQEQKFTEIINDLNSRKRKATEKMEDAIRRLGAVRSRAEADKALAVHREALKEYQAVQTAELDRLKPLLGSEKLARYLVVKSELTEKLKQLLSSPKPTEVKSDAAPKPVEQK